MNLTLIPNCSFCSHLVHLYIYAAAPHVLHYTLWDHKKTLGNSSKFFHTAILCHQYLQYVEKTGSSVHKFKHEDYKGLVRQVLAYPVTYSL